MTFYGHRHSEESKKKISESRRGKCHVTTAETRRKISDAKKGKKRPPFSEQWIKNMKRKGENNGNYGKKHPGLNKGKKHSVSVRKKISDTRKRLGLSVGKNNPKYGWNPTPEEKEKLRLLGLKGMYSQLGKPSKPELRFMSALLNSGITYFIHQYLYDLGVADFFVFPHIIIECDGNYWHSLPEHKIRDSRNTAYLQSQGFKVFRFMESEINKNVNACVKSMGIR